MTITLITEANKGIGPPGTLQDESEGALVVTQAEAAHGNTGWDPAPAHPTCVGLTLMTWENTDRYLRVMP